MGPVGTYQLAIPWIAPATRKDAIFASQGAIDPSSMPSSMMARSR